MVGAMCQRTSTGA